MNLVLQGLAAAEHDKLDALLHDVLGMVTVYLPASAAPISLAPNMEEFTTTNCPLLQATVRRQIELEQRASRLRVVAYLLRSRSHPFLPEEGAAAKLCQLWTLLFEYGALALCAVHYMNRFFGWINDSIRPGVLQRVCSSSSSSSSQEPVFVYYSQRAFVRNLQPLSLFEGRVAQLGSLWLRHPLHRRWKALVAPDSELAADPAFLSVRRDQVVGWSVQAPGNRWPARDRKRQREDLSRTRTLDAFLSHFPKPKQEKRTD